MWEVQRAHQNLQPRGLVLEPTSLLVLAARHSTKGQLASSSPPFAGENVTGTEPPGGIWVGWFVRWARCCSAVPSTALNLEQSSLRLAAPGWAAACFPPFHVSCGLNSNQREGKGKGRSSSGSAWGVAKPQRAAGFSPPLSSLSLRALRSASSCLEPDRSAALCLTMR